MATRSDILVWMDLEMTGLNPEDCTIVQLAMILTDKQLVQITEPLEITIWQPKSTLDTMEPFVKNMHIDSGLLKKINSSLISLRSAEKEVMKVLGANCTYNTAILSGNSIGQDRRFLLKYMPIVEGYLHYRQIDVSSIKILADAWYKKKFTKHNKGRHTALSDVYHSIEELKYYREKIFKNKL